MGDTIANNQKTSFYYITYYSHFVPNIYSIQYLNSLKRVDGQNLFCVSLLLNRNSATSVTHSNHVICIHNFNFQLQ
jgi:hypothetical protein